MGYPTAYRSGSAKFQGAGPAGISGGIGMIIAGGIPLHSVPTTAKTAAAGLMRLSKELRAIARAHELSRHEGNTELIPTSLPADDTRPVLPPLTTPTGPRTVPSKLEYERLGPKAIGEIGAALEWLGLGFLVPGQALSPHADAVRDARFPGARPGIGRYNNPAKMGPYGGALAGDVIAPQGKQSVQKGVDSNWISGGGCAFPGVDPKVCGPYLIEGSASCLGGQAGGCASTSGAAENLEQRIADGANNISQVTVYDPPSTFVAEQRFYEWTWSRVPGSRGLPMPKIVASPNMALATAFLTGAARQPAVQYDEPPPSRPVMPLHRRRRPGRGVKERKPGSVGGTMGLVVRGLLSAATEALDVLDAFHQALPGRFKTRERHDDRPKGDRRFPNVGGLTPQQKFRDLYRAWDKMTPTQFRKFTNEALANVAKDVAEDALIGAVAGPAGKSLGKNTGFGRLAGPAL